MNADDRDDRIFVPDEVRKLAEVLSGLGPEPGDLAQVRSRVLDLLDSVAAPSGAKHLASAVATLSPEPKDLTRARCRILGMLDGALPSDVRELAAALQQLGPVVDELANLKSRSETPGHDLLAAARRNT